METSVGFRGQYPPINYNLFDANGLVFVDSRSAVYHWAQRRLDEKILIVLTTLIVALYFY